MGVVEKANIARVSYHGQTVLVMSILYGEGSFSCGFWPFSLQLGPLLSYYLKTSKEHKIALNQSKMIETHEKTEIK